MAGQLYIVIGLHSYRTSYVHSYMTLTWDMFIFALLLEVVFQGGVGCIIDSVP